MTHRPIRILACLALVSALASALAACVAPPPPPGFTARDMDASCRELLARPTVPTNPAGAVCWRTMIDLLQTEGPFAPPGQRFCLPDPIKQSGDVLTPMAGAYVRWFATEGRRFANGDGFGAMARAQSVAWPCRYR